MNTVNNTPVNALKKYESDYKRNNLVRSIDGKSLPKKCVVAYCKSNIHPGFLTYEQRKNHHCEQQECKHYVDITEIQYNLKNNQVNRATSNICISRIKDIEEEIKSFVASHYCWIRIISIKQEVPKWICYYISITNDYDETEIEKRILKEFKMSVRLSKLSATDWSYEKCVLYIEKNKI